MTLDENLKIGLDSLLSQKLRSLLTMLGIIFGVAAVVSMQSIGAGAKKELLDAIRLLGVNNIIVKSLELDEEEIEKTLNRNPKRLHYADVTALRDVISEVHHIVPIRREETSIRMPVEIKATLLGTEPEYEYLQELKLVEGRFLRSSDNREKKSVAVLSAMLKREIFPLESAVGKRIKAGKNWFTVIGVIQPPGGGGIKGIEVRESDKDVYIPLETMQARIPLAIGESPLQEIVIQVEKEKMVRAIASTAGRMLLRRHKDAVDVEVVVPIELLKQSQKTQRIFNIVMGAIASISLLVGGIGIMNIMLANVLERTREIGVRRAVGASRRHIVFQFLLEATLLSIIGGIIGVIIGTLMAWIITQYAGWTTLVGFGAIALAFGVSAAVGILFGWWPAKRAAEMDVINALRYE
ncbi:MAG: ABC transporter permease [Candidatus Electryonea clarkiae]|nr:ABC transporter permease [Candidatus Electryonea clarkiae]MDP8286046.1 ABC transporter permease [Candidatus Electryonea clarkiae]